MPRSTAVADQVQEMIQSALAWRSLVQVFWTAMGGPPVPGFPASRVQQILWGELPPENGFFPALLSALTSRARAGVTAESWLHQSLLRVIEHPSPDVQLFAWDRASHPEADHGADMVMVDRENNTVTAVQVKDTCRVSGTGAAPVSESARSDGSDHKSWFDGIKGLIELGPDPDVLETEAEFMAALRELKKRKQLSLRQIEERSKTTTAGWLPRSSVADMLRRQTLPKPDALWALTAALGLTKQDQDKWEAARSRLHKQHRTLRRLRSALIQAGDPGPDEYHSQVNNDFDAQTA